MTSSVARALLASLAGFAAATSGCTVISGVDALETTTDGGAVLPGRDGSAARPPENDGGQTPSDASKPGPTGWAHRRPITLSNKTSGALASHAVLVVLPATFDYGKAKPDGADLRFSRAADHGDDLPYFIESWQPGGASYVWVLAPEVPQGSSDLQMFYGNPNAPAASTFATVFPSARITTGGGGGSFTANGDIAVDWFELKAGDTLTLAAGTPLEISARRIIVAGTIQGDGRGYPGGPDAANLAGKGPGGGGPAGGSASGGAGHGGAGGRGGADQAGTGGAGGATYGSATDANVDMGSGGASADPAVGFKQGGAGGGAVSLLGWRTTVSGTISVNGVNGAGGGGRNAGGGAGGGIVVAGAFLDLAGATLSAKGGAGGPCANMGNDGGGGGGGGRIKLHTRAAGSFTAAASMSVAFGPGGAGSGTTAPGDNGLAGTTNVNDNSDAPSGVGTSLGAETLGR